MGSQWCSKELWVSFPSFNQSIHSRSWGSTGGHGPPLRSPVSKCRNGWLEGGGHSATTRLTVGTQEQGGPRRGKVTDPVAHNQGLQQLWQFWQGCYPASAKEQVQWKLGDSKGALSFRRGQEEPEAGLAGFLEVQEVFKFTQFTMVLFSFLNSHQNGNEEKKQLFCLYSWDSYLPSLL